MNELILGRVTAVSAPNGLSVAIDGRGTGSSKYYKCNADGSYAIGDRVLLASVSGTYIVLCKVGNPVINT